MWSDLLDAHGRKRAAIFYKAAFYDRSATISLCCRYMSTLEPKDGYAQSYDYETTAWVGMVRDNATNAVLWRTEPQAPVGQDKPWTLWERLEEESRQKLDEMFPHHRDPLAYWDQE